MDMRPSRTLAKLRRGEIVKCVKLNLVDPRVAEIAGLCGFDCIWLDQEHTATTLIAVENMIRAVKVHDVDTVVRVSRGSYSELICPLELDAAGIMVPHVMNLDDAKRIVHHTRFHPIGRRPLDGGNADGSFCLLPGERYIAQANEQRFVILQIEDPEPLAELEEIAQVAGVDMLFFGPADFSQGIGAPLCFDDPRIDQARRLVAETARRHGKFAGTVGNPKSLPGLRKMGYQFISMGADVVGLGDYFQSIISSFESCKAQPTEQ
jgi:4-hydroxy-2-oxoheptanedioate aldolase